VFAGCCRRDFSANFFLFRGRRSRGPGGASAFSSAVFLLLDAFQLTDIKEKLTGCYIKLVVQRNQSIFSHRIYAAKVSFLVDVPPAFRRSSL